MGRTARERLAKLLEDAQASGAFSAQILVPADALQVEVDGVGAVHPPVRAPLAKKLIAVARPAMFGRGEQTLTDTGVRDTWEITSDLVTLGGPAWEATLGAVLDDIRDELGLPPTTKLRAALHAMLVYGKGQFFLPHQDSEKDDAMVGTLVVSLPSVHTGGELVVEHGGQSVMYRVPREELSFVAFYADCRHEVKPVKSGYRVTLTFNLLADSEVDAQEPGQVGGLAHCLTGHFTTPARRRYGRTEPGPPNRLVYLLDHEYSQRGLSWNRLKGADAERAALLRAAAERAGCEAVLALAEVKETWDAWPFDGDYYDTEDEDDEEDYDDGGVSRGRGGDHDDYQLNELVNEITLGWWTSPDGAGGEPISLHVPDSEVCATTPSADLVPYQSEYEGYMGNYGNTLDRWYRRAAVVVRPLDRAFAARAEAGSQWGAVGIGHPHRGRRPGGGARAGGGVARAVLEKDRIAGRVCWARRWHVAAGLGAAGTAATVLEPFRVETGCAGSTRVGWPLRPDSTARRGRAGSSPGGSGRGTTLGRTDTSGWRGCRGCARRCVPPRVRRRRGCWPPVLGTGWAISWLGLWTTTARTEAPPGTAWRAEARRWCGCWRQPTTSCGTRSWRR